MTSTTLEVTFYGNVLLRKNGEEVETFPLDVVGQLELNESDGFADEKHYHLTAYAESGIYEVEVTAEQLPEEYEIRILNALIREHLAEVAATEEVA